MTKKTMIIMITIFVLASLLIATYIGLAIKDKVIYDKYVDYIETHDEDAPIKIVSHDTLLDMHLFITEDKDGDTELHILREVDGDIKEITIGE